MEEEYAGDVERCGMNMDKKGLNNLIDIFKKGEFFKIFNTDEKERFDEYLKAFTHEFPELLPLEIKELVTAEMLCERIDMALWEKNLDDMDSATASTVKTIIETSRKYRKTLLDYYRDIRKDQQFGDVNIKNSFEKALEDVTKDGKLSLKWVGDKEKGNENE